MGLWTDIVGSVRGYIRLGLTGVRLKNSSGALAVRNAGDSDYAAIEAGSVYSNGALLGQAAWTLIDDTDSPYTATAGQRLMVDTTAGAVTVTLPASPSAGNKVVLADYAGTFATYNLTVGRNSSKIMSLSEDMIASDNYVAFELEYIDSTKGWAVI